VGPPQKGGCFGEERCGCVPSGDVDVVCRGVGAASPAGESAGSAGQTAGRRNLAVKRIRDKSSLLRGMAAKGEIKIVGAMRDVKTGKVTFVE
jgi:hypothetical protein